MSEQMNEAKDVRCVFCEKYNCDCEESKALDWLLDQSDPPRWSAFEVARALVAYRRDIDKRRQNERTE